MKIQGYALPQVKVDGVQTRLYAHQAAMLNEWNNHDAFMLTTKTGSGKTRAVALPILRDRESAVLVYPTNALIADQARSIQQLMREEGISFRQWTPENANHKLGREEYLIVQVSAAMLDAFRQAWQMKYKSDALLRLLQQDKRKLVLINPDILFLIFALRYGRTSSQAIAHLQAYKTVVFDEFHLYTGVELTHALFMIHLARCMGTFQRVVLLSATPNVEVRKHLDALLSPRMIDAKVKISQPVISERQVAHEVELLPLPTKGDIVEVAQLKILELADELRQLQRLNGEANSDGSYVPGVVILNSVVNAIALEDALVEAGMARELMAPIRGLSSRRSRDVRGKLLVIGTSAIEVGIDFRADYLLFEPGDRASFMQRFGRIGRHTPGKAILLCNYREATALRGLGKEISRSTLELGVTAIYPQQDARAWFVTTFGGMVTVCAQADSFKQKILGDRSADDAMKERINQWMDETLLDYAQKLGIERVLKQTRPKLRRKWFAHYAEINSFRTSLPSQEVWDISERERGREWNYNADVKTLLFRAEQLWFNDKHERLYVRGYGSKKQVWFTKSFDDMPELVATIQTTADYSTDEMQFLRDGHSTPISHVMHEPQHHIFVFVPIELRHQLDWRIAWFRCGKAGRYLIAFDGDALLVREIYDQQR